MSQQRNTNSSSSSFRHELGLFDSTMIVIGSMIGSGIFIVSSDIARSVGSAGLLLLVWLIAGVITLIAALSYGELAAMMPKAGGQYIYLCEAYNPLVGFLYGWTLFLIIQSGTIAAVAVAFAKFAGVLVPRLGTNNVLFTILGLKISAGQLLAIFIISILSSINIKGLKHGKLVQNIFTTAKIVSISGLIVLGIFVGANALAIGANFTNIWNGQWSHMSAGKIEWVEQLSGFSVIIAIGVAMVGSLFSSDAWNNITFTAGEVKNPKKNIPLSLLIGTLTVTIIYMMVNVSYLLVLPLRGDLNGTSITSLGIQFAAGDRVATAATNIFLGEPAVIIMAVLL